MDMMETRRRILLNTPHIETAEGEIIKITNVVKSNAKAVEVSFDQPEAQDLHGYAKPWLGGEGKNLFDKEHATVFNRYVTETGNWAWSNSNDSASIAFKCEPNTDYVITAINEDITIFRTAYIVVDELPSTTATGSLNGYSATRTTSQGSIQMHTGEDATYIVVQVNKPHIADTLIQIEKGTTASPYEPYENYCPITGGITGLTVCRTGKNIFDKDHAEYVTKKYIDDSGAIKSQSSYQYIENYIPVKPNTIYAVQMNRGTASAGFTVPMYDANKNFILREVAIGSGSAGGVVYGSFTTTAETKYIRFSCPVSANVRPTIMIEEGSQSSEYEPFGEQYLVSWETEAGIAYKGTLNLTTGVLHVDNLVWTFDGTEGWSMQWGTSTANGVFRINSPAMLPNPADNIISNFDIYQNVTSTNTNHGIFFHRGSTYLNIRNNRCAYLNGRTQLQVVAEWKAFLAQRYAEGQPLEILCRGVDKSYQLTPRQVKLLTGTNNIWADTGSTRIAYWKH